MYFIQFVIIYVSIKLRFTVYIGGFTLRMRYPQSPCMHGKIDEGRWSERGMAESSGLAFVYVSEKS